MKYVVIGGAGFIGSNLVDLLIEEGHEVHVIDNLSTGFMSNVNEKSVFHNFDISLYNFCKTENAQGKALNVFYEMMMEAIEDSDGVFHFAALARVQPSIEEPFEYHKANIDGTLNALSLCKDIGAQRFVYSASSSAYGDTDILPTPETTPTDPLSPYGLQKLVGEQYCRVFSHCYGLDTVSLRYFNVFGPRQVLEGAYALVISTFAKQRIAGDPITITGDGEQRRDFTYVGDVAKANLLAMKSSGKFNGEVINIGNGDNRSINQIADLMGGERKYIEKRLEPRETLADNSKAKSLLKWSPSVNVEDWIPSYKKSLHID